MATTKFWGLFLKRNNLDIPTEQRYDTSVWVAKIKGMTASSTSLSAVNWDASLVKTVKTVSSSVVL